ncbi:glycosyltransferase [Solibacillus sp. FSL K6-1554]|uniref:glycosyltransferase n=1 Tax=Solibacillus sp. FSL K6-1554 TaxID=2921472 RepID=UPI0030F98666
MNILVITYSRIPEGDAEAVRLLTLGEALRGSGNDVFFIGMGFSKYKKEMNYKGFKYNSLRKESKHITQKVYYYLNYNKRLKRFLKVYLLHNKVDAILIADLPIVSVSWLKSFCMKNNIQFLADSVEWYSPEQFKYGNLSLDMLLKNMENKYFLDKNVKIISISKYLNNYFRSKGCNTIRIPVILDVKNIPYEKIVKDNKLAILYAGSPGKKDYLNEMLRGLLLLEDEDLKRLRFTVAGVSYEQIKNWFTHEEFIRLNNYVEFLGRVDRTVVLNKLAEIDFTVLLRAAELRYAKAGFPTKVVESLATATPVILNLSSDLGDYINDMQEGLIVKECSAEEFAKTLKRALLLKQDQKELMRHKARLCAEENFDYRLYQEHLSKLLF